jgi:tetraacyldisaccharide 4'-kinase
MPLQFKFLRWGDWLIQKKLSIILAPIAMIWGLCSQLRNTLYDRGWLPIHRVPALVVSIGNLSAGGNGKTPFVLLLAKQFPHRKIAILSRGYGASTGLNDEMQLIQRHLPQARLYQDPDRVQAAKQAVADGAELILLDDGFQHRRLYRDFDLVLVHPNDPEDHYLPWGRLRDSYKSLARAEPIDIRFLETHVTGLFNQKGQKIPSIRGERVALFCGIGRPERFKKTVESLGAIVCSETILADHEPLKKIPNLLNIKYLLCTEKDFLKLPPTDLPLLYVAIETAISPAFTRWQMLIEKIDQRLNNLYRYG